MIRAPIVKWEPGYYPDIRTADIHQQRCYQKIKKNLDIGNFIDVESNDAYLYYYNIELHSKLCSTRNDEQLAQIRELNDKFIRNYTHVKPKVVKYFYPDLIFADLLLFLKQDKTKILYDINRLIYFCIDNKLATNIELIVSAYITAGDFTSSMYIDPSIIKAFISTSLRTHMTKFGKEHEVEVIQNLYNFLDADFEYSMRNFLYNMYDFTDGVAYLDSYGNCRCEPTPEVPSDALMKIYNIKVPIYNEVKLKAYLKSIVREAENIYRNSIGLQEVGQGWLSETLLFRRIEVALPTLTVEQHASPSFLGRQHYDVYIPKYKIALEYQGEQHYSSVDYFGGEEALKRNQERDARKRTLSEKNGVTQIDVRPGYLLDDLFSVLNDILTKYDVSIDNNALERARNIPIRDNRNSHQNSLRKASENVSKFVKKSIDDDKELTRKAKYLLNKIQVEPCKPVDPNDIFSIDKIIEFDEMYMSTFPVNETSTEESIKTLQSMIDQGYITASLFGDLANKYHKLGNYRMELLTLLKAQKKYGWDFITYIKPLLKSHSEEFEDLFVDL